MRKEKEENQKKINEILKCKEETGCSYLEVTCHCKNLGDGMISLISFLDELSAKLLVGHTCVEFKPDKKILTKTNDNGKIVSNDELSELDKLKVDLKFSRSYLQGLQKSILDDVLDSIYGCQFRELRDLPPLILY